eukprot:scaffold19144_cov118-Isochrysis_galbana.AAC.3
MGGVWSCGALASGHWRLGPWERGRGYPIISTDLGAKKSTLSPCTSPSSKKPKPKAKGGDGWEVLSTARAASSAMSQPSYAVRIRACFPMLLACAPLGAAS